MMTMLMILSIMSPIVLSFMKYKIIPDWDTVSREYRYYDKKPYGEFTEDIKVLFWVLVGLSAIPYVNISIFIVIMLHKISKIGKPKNNKDK